MPQKVSALPLRIFLQEKHARPRLGAEKEFWTDFANVHVGSLLDPPDSDARRPAGPLQVVTLRYVTRWPLLARRLQLQSGGRRAAWMSRSD